MTKITTGSGRAALIAVMILCGAAALLSSGVWIRAGGHEIDMWKCVRSIGNVSAEAWLTQYSAGVRSFLGTVCLLQWGCAVLHILAIYELWKKGESVLIYGAISAVIILFCNPLVLQYRLHWRRKQYGGRYIFRMYTAECTRVGSAGDSMRSGYSLQRVGEDENEGVTNGTNVLSARQKIQKTRLHSIDFCHFWRYNKNTYGQDILHYAGCPALATFAKYVCFAPVHGSLFRGN